MRKSALTTSLSRTRTPSLVVRLMPRQNYIAVIPIDGGQQLLLLPTPLVSFHSTLNTPERTTRTHPTAAVNVSTTTTVGKVAMTWIPSATWRRVKVAFAVDMVVVFVEEVTPAFLTLLDPVGLMNPCSGHHDLSGRPALGLSPLLGHVTSPFSSRSIHSAKPAFGVHCRIPPRGFGTSLELSVYVQGLPDARPI